uniref:Zona pellucida sperm-binding protein 4 n=2 Tax=Gouania willdenowi TaxID=441366 RepID=A0A8C5EHV5_GOUWI
MGKHQSLNLFVTLALLGCLAGIGANAQVHAIKSPPPPNQNPWIPTGTSQIPTPTLAPRPGHHNQPYAYTQRLPSPSLAPRPGHQNQPYTYTQRLPTPTMAPRPGHQNQLHTYTQRLPTPTLGPQPGHQNQPYTYTKRHPTPTLAPRPGHQNQPYTYTQRYPTPTSAPRPGHQNQPYTYTQRYPTPTLAPRPGHQNQPHTYTQIIPTSPPPGNSYHPNTGGHFHQKPPSQQQQQSGRPTYPVPPTLLPGPELNCDVKQNVRVPCGPSDCVADYCTAIGCCHDGNQCYYGKAVTVQCTKDGQFIVVASKDATIPHLDTESITLLEQGSHCGPMDSNSLFAIYQFPVTACGTMVMEEDSAIIYENKLTASVEVLYGNYGAITRDSHYDLVFQCKYLGYSVQAVVQEIIQFDHLMEPAVALGPVNIQMWLGNGQCTTKGCDEMSVAFDSYYTEMDYPVTKSLREPVFVEVQILDRADPMLVLTLDRCWTTTSQSPHSMPQWDLLVNGCPYSDDHYMATLLPVPSYLDYPTHHRRFSFRMFTFVDQMSAEPQQQHVYIHCSTSLCTPHMGSGCEPTCYKKQKREAPVIRKTERKSVVSSKLVILKA